MNVLQGGETVGIICKSMNFSSEEKAIRNQVCQGLRCTGCLKPFNSGERKHFKAGSGAVICRRCHGNEISCDIPKEEAKSQ